MRLVNSRFLHQAQFVLNRQFHIESIRYDVAAGEAVKHLDRYPFRFRHGRSGYPTHVPRTATEAACFCTPLIWCPGPDSNRHDAVRRRRILSPLCLPVSPPGRGSTTPRLLYWHRCHCGRGFANARIAPACRAAHWRRSKQCTGDDGHEGPKPAYRRGGIWINSASCSLVSGVAVNLSATASCTIWSSPTILSGSTADLGKKPSRVCLAVATEMPTKSA